MTEKGQNKFGLTERDMATIQAVLSKYSEIEAVIIFGSRAKGVYKSGSDIDLAIMGDGVNDAVICKLKDDFSDSCLPYFVDLLSYSSLKNDALREHIDRVGVPLEKFTNQGAFWPR